MACSAPSSLPTLWTPPSRGPEHFSSFGVSYPIRQGVLFILAMAATAIADRRYHATFVIIAIASEIFWILSQFQVLE
ncbi:MAG TPA: hypothetical protein VGJ75_26780 [Dongiaceae bacterium]|jgi:hypothetical protein